MNSVVLVESQALKLRFGSNRTASKIWQEGQHDLHSPPQPIDWREHTIGAVHDRNLPTRSLHTSTRKLRKFPVTSGRGSKHRDWTASRWWARWRSQSSSCQHHVITWRVLIPADHEYLDSVVWPCHDCEVAPVWHHDVTNPRTCQFSAVCLTVFPFEFRPRTFTIGFYGKNSIISELMILECSFPLSLLFVTRLDSMCMLLCIRLKTFLYLRKLLSSYLPSPTLPTLPFLPSSPPPPSKLNFLTVLARRAGVKVVTETLLWRDAASTVGADVGQAEGWKETRNKHKYKLVTSWENPPRKCNFNSSMELSPLAK